MVEPNPKDNPDGSGEPSLYDINDDRQFQTYNKKLNCLFSSLTQIHDSIAQLEDTEESIDQFFADSFCVDMIRKEFMETLESRNNYQVRINNASIPIYSHILSFDKLYSRIKYKQHQLKNKSGGEGFKPKPPQTNRMLPKLELIPFNGEQESWPLFYEIFRTTIHENDQLTASEKIQYLMSQLSGKARHSIGVSPTAENYQSIWNGLVEKYNDKRVQATAYLNKLLNLPAISEVNATNLESFVDNYSSLVSALKNLNIPLEDFIFVHLGSRKIGTETLKDFEKTLEDASNLPTTDEFVRFLRSQSRVLQRSGQSGPNPTAGQKRSQGVPKISKSAKPANAQQSNVRTFVVQESNPGQSKCVCCSKSDHSQLYLCPDFVGLDSKKRYEFVKTNKLCLNCMSNLHLVRQCKSKNTCKYCSSLHHSLLHFENVIHPVNNVSIETKTPPLAIMDTPSSELATDTTQAQPSAPSQKCLVANYRDRDPSATARSNTVLLGTAQCNVLDSDGNIVVLRVLIDSASQRDLIVADCCKRLNLPLFPPQTKYVSGIGEIKNDIKAETCLTIRSRIDDLVRFTIQPIVVERITNELPTAKVDSNALDYLDSIQLADANYCTPGPIDMILGANIFARILRPNRIARADSEPIAMETSLGYIVVGNAPSVPIPSCNFVQTFKITEEFEDRMSKFLQIEDVPSSPTAMLTPDELKCEQLYCDSTHRDSSGRFIVSLPFKDDSTALGDSMKRAERQYLSLERRLLSKPVIKEQYDAVVSEYLQKGYLKPVGIVSELASEHQYVIPHHAVVRMDKSSTKLRVVLNASMPTSSGKSLNDLLYTGPNLQNDLFSILLTFRLFAIAISADIRQMYLRILVEERDQRFQRILYRFNDKSPIQVFEMTRVAFGLCCSPFLAIRTVRQLAQEEKEKFPEAAAVAEKDIYMDDLVTSCTSAAHGAALSNQLIDLFATAGFEMVKFSSNSPQVMENIPSSHRIMDAVEFSPESDLKILGLRWLPADDYFTFMVNASSGECTKRKILSAIARLWDLMGFIAPVTLLAKLIIKSLWEGNVGWDDIPPQNIVSLWRQFESELHLLETIRLPRHVGVETECVVTLLGCADASERAYGGVVYLHVYFPAKNCSDINLICAKSKVAPSRTVISLARMELCANLVLSQLMKTVIDAYASRCTISNVFAFTDSTVALAWIHSSPAKWQTFVANRVAKIQQNVPSQHFYHIPGIDNPADCLSRGLTPAQLVDHPLWFSGPAFARFPVQDWPVESFDANAPVELPEMKVTTLVTTDNDSHRKPLFYELASRISSWPKLLRIVVYVLRFLKKLPRKFEISHLETAEITILRAVQQVHFQRELDIAQSGKTLPPAFLRLNAFVDNGLLRVGGRLSNASIDYESQHQILLPRRDHIVDLIIDYVHRKYCHAGPHLVMSLLRQHYWILAARNIVRTRIHKCNQCFRANPKNENPIMADLPECRVNQAKVFYHTGVDYAGPLTVIPFRRRGVKSIKIYICLFICLVTKATHIEMASDLSTETFINALKRFLSRRGPVGVIYSDRGTNFVGAKTQLDNLYKLLDSDEYKAKFAHELRENRIEWRFNPASAPHFGGIWEGNIRSLKTHLNRVIGSQLLTSEEMHTVLTQIEAVLNSRPLTLLSSDPNEPLALTPAHFLTLTPLKSLPASNVFDENVSLRDRKQMLDHLVQSFWNRWRVEYLTSLQQRTKWLTSSGQPVSSGTVVLLKADNVAPLQWPLGVIEKVYPGRDGVIRVVDVRTNSGLYRRPVVKVCPLPAQ